MTKAQHLKTCDLTLSILLPFVLASAVQMEATGSGGIWPVVAHMAVSAIFICLIIRHLYLHFKWSRWLWKLRKLKVATRILWWLYVLTFISGLAAMIHWLSGNGHGPLGGIHGKIGFLMLAFALAHTLKRIRFFKKLR